MGQAIFFFWWGVRPKRKKGKKKVSEASHQNLHLFRVVVAYSTGAGMGVNLTGFEALLWGRLMHGCEAVFLAA